MKKFFIIAGEASGDIIGSKLIRELKILVPDSIFIGVGGRLMQQEGLVSIFPMEELAIMGFVEVVPHLARLLRRIKQTAETINKEQPDYVITIDSPDFCFRVIKKLSPGKFKKVHIVAPSVWAYRAGRAKAIAKIYDLLLCILPFEPPYFTKFGLKAVFIGHPLIETNPSLIEGKDINNIVNRELLIAVTPGSRNSEVKRIFPEFIEALNLLKDQLPNLKVVIFLTDKTKDLVMKMSETLNVPYSFCSHNDKQSMLSKIDFALAKSGTNSLEFSLNKIPIIVAYKINWLSYFLAKILIKIKYANLINLILNKEAIPELLQQKCNAVEIARNLKALINNNDMAQKQIKEASAALSTLYHGKHPSQNAAREIINLK